jgi:hypothetical protein
MLGSASCYSIGFQRPLEADRCPEIGRKLAGAHGWYLAWHNHASYTLGRLGGDKVTHQKKSWVQIMGRVSLIPRVGIHYMEP